MPNTPAIIGQGESAICFSKTNEEIKEYVINLFKTCGAAIEVEEKKMDAVTGLSGSGPAYVLMFIEALTDAGVKLGLTREEANLLACATVKGTAAMVMETNTHPAKLKDSVCSPGGTTINAVYSLEKNGFRGAVMDAVIASATRSKELGEK